MKTPGKSKAQGTQKHGRLAPERQAIMQNPELANETYRRADEVHRAAEELHNTIREVGRTVSEVKTQHGKRPAASVTGAPGTQSRRRRSRAKSDAAR